MMLLSHITITKRKQKGRRYSSISKRLYSSSNCSQEKGTASDVLQRFFKFVNRRVYLSVRSDNEIAINFYLKNDMKLVGKTTWAKGNTAR